MSRKFGVIDRLLSFKMLCFQLFTMPLMLFVVLVVTAACVSSDRGTSSKIPRIDRDSGEDTAGGLPLSTLNGSMAGPAPAPTEALKASEAGRLIAGPISARVIKSNQHLKGFEGELVLGNSDVQVVVEGAGYGLGGVVWHPLIKTVFLSDDEGRWRQIRDIWDQGFLDISFLDSKSKGIGSATAITAIDPTVDRELGIAKLTLGVSSGTPESVSEIVMTLSRSGSLIDVDVKHSGWKVRVSSLQRSWLPGTSQFEKESEPNNKQSGAVPYLFSRPGFIDPESPDPAIIISSRGSFTVQRQRKFHVLTYVSTRGETANKNGSSTASTSGFVVAVGQKATSLFPLMQKSISDCGKRGNSRRDLNSCMDEVSQTTFVAGTGSAPVYPVSWTLLSPAGLPVTEGIWSRKNETLFTFAAQQTIKGWSLLVDRDPGRGISLEGAVVVPSKLGDIRAVIALPESSVRSVIFSLNSTSGKSRPAILEINRIDPRGDLALMGASVRKSSVIILGSNKILVKRWPFKLELPVGRYSSSLSIGQAGEICRAEFSLSPASKVSQNVVCKLEDALLKRRSFDSFYFDPIPIPSRLAGVDSKTWRLIGWTDAAGADVMRGEKVDANTGWSLYWYSKKSDFEGSVVDSYRSSSKLEELPAGSGGIDIESAGGAESIRDISKWIRREYPKSHLVLGCPRNGATEKSIREAIILTTPDSVSSLGCDGDIKDSDIVKAIDSAFKGTGSPTPALFTALDAPGRFNPFMAIQFDGSARNVEAEELISRLNKHSFGVAAGGRLQLKSISKTDDSKGLELEVGYEADLGIEATRVVVSLLNGSASDTKLNSKQSATVPIQIAYKNKSKKLRIDLYGRTISGGESMLATTNYIEIDPYLYKNK